MNRIDLINQISPALSCNIPLEVIESLSQEKLELINAELTKARKINQDPKICRISNYDYRISFTIELGLDISNLLEV